MDTVNPQTIGRLPRTLAVWAGALVLVWAVSTVAHPLSHLGDQLWVLDRCPVCHALRAQHNPPAPPAVTPSAEPMGAAVVRPCLPPAARLGRLLPSPRAPPSLLPA